MNTTTLHIQFEPVDTWFFREARPHDSVGAARLGSQFPPPASSLIGTLRTRLGEVLGIDWIEHAGQDELPGRCTQEFAGINLSDLLGQGDNTGLLAFGAVEVWNGEQRLLPVPAFLLKPGSASQSESLLALQPGAPMVCDLSEIDPARGRLAAVVMPALPAGSEGAKPLDNHWLPASLVAEAALSGNAINAKELVAESDLFVREARLGIARDNKAGTVLEGMLYQTEHLRPVADLRLAISVTLPAEVADVLADSLNQQPLQRFGGEGRMARLRVSKSVIPVAKPPKATADTRGLVLMLSGDVELESRQSRQSSLFGFKPVVEACSQTGKPQQVWLGELNGVPLRLVTAVVGKAVRRGGWDLQKKRPKAMTSYVPAGSCWYVEIPGVEGVALNEFIPRLQGFQPGKPSLNGRGALLCGLWNKR